MNKINELKDKIKNLYKEIDQIQSECIHPKSSLDIKYNCSTGGWDPDTYWKEFTCGLCGKKWTEDVAD